MVDTKGLQNLNQNDKIVNPDGTPTQFFMRLLQAGNGITGDLGTEVENLRSINIETTAPIEGGPYPFADHEDGDPPLTLSHADSGAAPGVYGDATHSAKITVDEKGHITDAVAVPISGGGGGGPWYFAPPLVADFAATTYGTYTATDDADVGMILSSTTQNRFNMGGEALPAATDWNVTMHFNGDLTTANYANIGMAVCMAAHTKFVGWSQDGRSALHLYNYNATSFDGFEQFVNYPNNIPSWLRMNYVTATGILSVDASADGKLWYTNLLSYNVKAYMGADPQFIGPFAQIESGVFFSGLSVDHWSKSF